jgi:hypothetical protein
MKPKPECHRQIIIEREEYDALMAELPTPEVDPKPPDGSPELEEKLRKIEFSMMIIVGLILVVLLLSISKGN